MAPRTTLRKIHWRVPTVIILAFVAGLAFALGHHAFYSSLDGRPVDDRLFNQQVNLAVGQAFAFLVRASLVISVGASYWQVFWGTVLHGSLAISQVDALAGMLGSVLDLLNLKASTTHPLLLVLALLSWMVPLASILPPATLSVHNTTRTEFEDRRVPIPRFNASSMATLATESASGSVTVDVQYFNPARQLARLVTATAYRGDVPDHHTAFPNSTYTFDFSGPAVRCQNVSEDLLHDFNDAMNCSFIVNESDDGPKVECSHLVTYLSWVPGKELNNERNLTAVESSIPFKSNSMINIGSPWKLPSPGSAYDPRYIGGFTDGAASVYLATRSQRLPYDLGNWDVLNCSMYNGSYTVKVTSDSNSRGIFSKPEIRTLNRVPFDVHVPKDSLDKALPADTSATFGYLALMESFNRLIVGTISGGTWSRVENSKYYDEKDLDVQNEAFKQTLLPFTTELLPFLGYRYYLGSSGNGEPPNFKQWTLVETVNNWTVSYPKEAFSSSTFNRSLSLVLEELFQNITLSLFSSPYFTEDSADYIEIRYDTPQNTYAYDSRNLLISYGLAVGFALIAGIAGCASILSNGASYSNRFSTVLRTTRGHELEELVVHNDRTGVDPLPKHLEKSRIDLRRGQVESERDVDAWRPENVSEQTSMIGILPRDGQVSASS
jgi:hypothetical protein